VKYNEDELDILISAWTELRSPYEVMHILQESGVPAGAVLNNKELIEDAHFKARGFFQKVNHGSVGTHVHMGLPWRLSDTPLTVRDFAPEIGQHSQSVLSELLGVEDREFERLVGMNVTSGMPKSVGYKLKE